MTKSPLQIAEEIQKQYKANSLEQKFAHLANALAQAVVGLTGENEKLNAYVKEVVEQYDRIKFEKQSQALREVRGVLADCKKALDYVVSEGQTQPMIIWDARDETKEWLKKYGEMGKST